MFVEGKRLVSFLDGTAAKLVETTSKKEQADWTANNAQVTSWLLAAVEPNIALSLRSFSSASAMWTHLGSLHSQQSASCQYEISHAIASLSQGDSDVSTYYQAALHLWTEEDMVSAALTKGVVPAAMITERQRLRLMQFLLKLNSDFESVRASLLHRNVTKMDEVLAELLREETRLRSSSSIGSVFSWWRVCFCCWPFWESTISASGSVSC
ncbi:hypothetical protein LINGRAHAP2_LOCUS2944 [Linum grandiflorum]